MKLLASVSLSACLLCSSLALAEGAEKAPADAPAAASSSQLGDLSFFPARYQFVDDFSAEYGSVTSKFDDPHGTSADLKTTTFSLKNQLEYSFFPKQAVLLNLGYELQKNSDLYLSPSMSYASFSANRLQGPELGYKVRVLDSALLNFDLEAMYDTGLLEKEITYENPIGAMYAPRAAFWKGSKITATAKVLGRLNESLEYSVSPYFIYHAKQKLKISDPNLSGEVETNSYSDFGISLSGLTHLTNQYSLLIGGMFRHNGTRTLLVSGGSQESPSYETFGFNAGIQANLIPNRVLSYLNFSYLHDSDLKYPGEVSFNVSASGWNGTLGVKVAL